MPRGPGGDAIASLLDALRNHLADDPAGQVLVDGLVSYLDPAHPAARARRIAEYARPTGTPLPAELKNPPPNYRVVEVAERLRVSRWWVLRRIQDGQIPAYRIGREWRITQATLDSLLDGGAA